MIYYLRATIFWGLMLSVLAFTAGCGGSENSTDDEGTGTDTQETSTLKINEIVASAEDDGDDWFELYVTEGSVTLGDYTIVDDDPDHDTQDLPDLTLNEGEYVVIQAIDSEDACPADSYCVFFKLGSSDSLTLYYGDTSMDTLAWEDGDAEQGYSYGLLPDGTGSAQTLTPTPDSTNQAAEDDDSDDDSGDDDTDTVEDSDPDLVINEIVAKAIDGGDDWIEFYVSGDQSVNLSDYRVVDDNDDNNSQALPNVTLVPGEFYVVYAADEAPEDGSDFVAFKLGSNDSVSLFEGDDLIDKLDWDDGQALFGYSYGRYTDGSGFARTLTPTPGSENEVADHGPLVINEIVSRAADDGYDWFEIYNAGGSAIALSQYSVVDDGADQEPEALPDVTLGAGEFIVIYATDAETDDDHVTFKLGSSDSLSLIFNDETVDYLEWDDSDAPQGYSYGRYPDGSWDAQTLPPTPGSTNEALTFFSVDTVNSLYIEIDTADWQDILANPLNETYHSATITYKGVVLENVAFRTKGNSSLRAVANMSSQRYSFKVDMNYYVDGQKLLNMKKINLNNNYKDPSYMRERLSYDLMRYLELPTPRMAYVNLYINGDLHGLYGLVEQVDSEFLEANFSNPDGDLYKPDGTGSDLLWQGSNMSTYTGVALKTNEESSDNEAFIDMLDELNNGSDFASVLDVDQALRYLAVSTALSNLDSYQGILAHNYYLYEEDGLFTLIPWDLNESFGTFRMGCDDDSMITLYIDEPTSDDMDQRPLIDNLLANGEYTDTYHDYIQDLLDGPLDPDVMEATIDATKTLIQTHVANDPTAFYPYYQFEASLGNAQFNNEIFGLQYFVNLRTANLQNQIDGSAISQGDGSGSCTGNDPGAPPGTPPF